jgi:cytochrome c oxidase cbb3-type subunit 4
MTYAAINHFAQSWGLILLLALFLAAAAYALWPANRDTFKRAGAIPLEKDDDERD